MQVNPLQVDIPDEMKNLVRIYRINVEVTFELFSDIAAAIQPLKHLDGSDDLRALELYDEFILNALAVFDDHDFEILEEHGSPFEGSHSYYCTLVKRDQLKDMKYKYILFVRLSDHTNREASAASKRKFYHEEAQRLKQPTTKSKQTWRLKEITVNKDTYNSYDEALDDIDKRLP